MRNWVKDYLYFFGCWKASLIATTVVLVLVLVLVLVVLVVTVFEKCLRLC